MIENGAIVTYVGTWKTDGFDVHSTTLGKVADKLRNAFSLAVVSSSVTDPFASLFKFTFDVRLQVKVENGLGYSSTDDIVSIVRNAVNSVTGDFPIADSIPTVQHTSGSTDTTGEPAGNTGSGTPGGCIAGTGNGLDGGFDISCWFKNLTQTGLASVGFLGILLVVGIGIFIVASSRIR